MNMWRGCAAHGPNGSMGGSDALVRIALGMDKERTAEHWLIRATPVLQRMAGAESRFSVSMRLSEVAMLAAADELEAATREATWWMAANACPDLELGGASPKC